MSNFREQILQKRQEEVANSSGIKPAPVQDDGSLDEISKNHKFFGVQSVRSFPTTLELRLANGISESLVYSLIVKLRYDPSEGITIKTTTENVLIEGRNLEMLHSHLLSYRVQYIQANIGNDLTDEEGLFIKDIIIEDM